MIDILITSSSRPELLERTIVSFLKKINSQSLTFFYINEDYVNQFNSVDCLAVIGDCLGSYKVRLSCNNPPRGLSGAFKWFADLCSSEFIFYLQDDWEAIREIPILESIELMDKYSFINQIRYNKRKTMAYKGEKGEWVFEKKELEFDNYYLVTSDSWYFNPALWRASFILPFLKIDYPLKPSQRPFVWKLNQALGLAYKVKKERKKFVGLDFSNKVGTYIYGKIGEAPYFRHLGANNRTQFKSKKW